MSFPRNVLCKHLTPFNLSFTSSLDYTTLNPFSALYSNYPLSIERRNNLTPRKTLRNHRQRTGSVNPSEYRPDGGCKKISSECKCPVHRYIILSGRTRRRFDVLDDSVYYLVTMPDSDKPTPVRKQGHARVWLLHAIVVCKLQRPPSVTLPPRARFYARTPATLHSGTSFTPLKRRCR